MKTKEEFVIVKEGKLRKYQGPGGNVTIPKSVRRLGKKAFSGCTSLQNVTIPESVEEIDDSAFANCPNLTIHAPAGSRAEDFAMEHDIPFQSI